MHNVNITPFTPFIGISKEENKNMLKIIHTNIHPKETSKN